MNLKREFLHTVHGGHCFWCKCKTKLKVQANQRDLPKHASTVDHLINALDRPDELDQIVVNACHRCNQMRGNEANRDAPKEVRKARVEADKERYRRWVRECAIDSSYLNEKAPA